MIVKDIEEKGLFLKIRAISSLKKQSLFYYIFWLSPYLHHTTNEWIDTYQSLGLVYKH